MKITAAVVVSLAASTAAFVPNTGKNKVAHTQLQAQKNQWWGPAAAAFASLSLASQVVHANVNYDYGGKS